MTVHHIYETLQVLSSEKRQAYIPHTHQLPCPESSAIVIEKVYEQLGTSECSYFATHYRVRANGKVTDFLGWDEMLGTIAALTLTGKLHYSAYWEETYEEKQRIEKIRRRMGPLLDFEHGPNGRTEINWNCVG